MLQKLVGDLTDFLLKNEIVKAEDREIYDYGFEAVLSTVVNTVIVLVIGSLAHIFLESIVFLIAFAILRVYCGGYHARTHAGCILTFMLLYGSSMALVYVFPLEQAAWFSMAVGTVSLLFILKFAPIEHKNRPFVGNEYKNFRMMSRIIAAVEASFIFTISLFFSQYAKSALIVALAMLCVVFILALAKIIERKR